MTHTGVQILIPWRVRVHQWQTRKRRKPVDFLPLLAFRWVFQCAVYSKCKKTWCVNGQLAVMVEHVGSKAMHYFICFLSSLSHGCIFPNLSALLFCENNSISALFWFLFLEMWPKSHIGPAIIYNAGTVWWLCVCSRSYAGNSGTCSKSSIGSPLFFFHI